MTTLQIAIPDDVDEFLQSQVEGGNYRGTEDYVRHLIEEARESAAQQRLEELLLDGLKTPAEPWPSEDFRRLRAKYEA
jgi:antitoxin ParD1/3/4